jgi:hypothetical protein
MGKTAYNTYSTEAMERFKTILENSADSGKAKYFAIEVDGLKVVEKTNNVEEFDNYESFITDDTREILIYLYSTNAASPKHDKHYLKMEKRVVEKPVSEPTLSGIEIQNKIDAGIQAAQERWEKKELEKQIVELKEELEDAEEYVEKLEAKCEEYERNRNTLRGVNVGEALGVAAESVLRNNVGLLAQVPAMKGLAGLIDKDNKDKAKQLNTPAIPDSEVSFSANNTLSEEDKNMMQLLGEMKNVFNETELQQVMSIIGALSKDHSQIQIVNELLNNN